MLSGYHGDRVLTGQWLDIVVVMLTECRHGTSVVTSHGRALEQILFIQLSTFNIIMFQI